MIRLLEEEKVRQKKKTIFTLEEHSPNEIAVAAAK